MLVMNTNSHHRKGDMKSETMPAAASGHAGVIEDDDSVRQTAQVANQTVDVVDEGEVAAAWFTHVTGQPSRLVKVHPEAKPVIWPAK
jgi:hypothetical protein